MKKGELSSGEYIKLLSYVMSEISLIGARLEELANVADKVILGGKTFKQSKGEEKGGDE